jgi:hypothetical protein
VTAPTPRPFLVRAHATDATVPPLEEPFSRFGPALDRATQLASALAYRSAEIIDLNNTMYVQLSMLWAIPRELR